VVDTRHPAEFAAAHIPGSINVPLGAGFTTWAGWLVPYDRDFHLIVDDQCSPCLDEAVRDLAMIGLDRIGGFFGREVIGAWRAAGREPGVVTRITAAELRARLDAGTVVVIDVRGQVEWAAGHIPGALNIPVGHLADRIREVPHGIPVAVQCRSGARSAIAASVLQALGLSQVFDLAGGIVAWQQAGLSIEPAREAVAAR
jgi:hydroxyacylglutathione hydrolase